MWKNAWVEFQFEKDDGSDKIGYEEAKCENNQGSPKYDARVA